MPSKIEFVAFCAVFSVFTINVYVFGQGTSSFSRSQSSARGNGISGMASPCPNVFQYDWDGIECNGIIVAPSLPYGTPARLVARLSIGRVLPTKYAGSLEVIGPRAEVLHAMLNERPIRYKVYFLLAHPLPIVTTITLNDQLICSGPKVSGPIVTSITLEHTLYPHGQALNSRHMVPGQPGLEPGQPGLEPGQPGQEPGQPLPEALSKLNDANRKNMQEMNGAAPGLSVTPNLTLNADRIPGTGKPPLSPLTANIFSEMCGTSAAAATTPLIANGVATRRGRYPWLVALFTQRGLALEFTCAGTLISDRYVLTAAHCIRYGENPQLKPDEILLILGKHQIRKWTEVGSMLREASKITVHPEYQALSGDADLAAVELADAVPFTAHVRPVCLTTEWTADYESTAGVVVGWGRDEIGLKVTPVPHQVPVRVVSQEDCLRSSIEFRYITSNRTLCAAGVTPDSGPCSGDSGGGLFVRNTRNGRMYLRGVTSMSLADAATRTCDLKHFSVYVDVSKFDAWIRQFFV